MSGTPDMPHLWSGRFDRRPDTEVFEFGRSFPFDRRLFEDDLTGSIAWVEALAAGGVIDPQSAAQMSEGLSAILAEGRAHPASVDGPDEDVHAFVERRLVERIGPAGRRLHTGRSRNEQVSLDLRLYLKRRIPILQSQLLRLAAALVEQAAGAGQSLVPAYTHLRRAQPVLVAHFLLAHVAAVARDHRHLRFALDCADELPLGSGAVSGTSYAIDVHALGRRLGFSRVVANSIDAASDRDFVAVFLHAGSLAMVHLSRLAEDLILFTGEEFGYMELPDEMATGSSLMPQKKNPDPLELVRGKTGRAIGRLAGWLATMKGLPSGYNKDLQEDKEAVFEAEDTLAGSLSACAAIVSRVSVNTRRARDAASGLLLATEVVDYLVSRGMAFRDAHQLVGAIVRHLVSENRAFESLTLDEWRTFSDLFDQDVVETITPEAAVAARRTPQSTSPEAVASALAEARRWIDSESGRREA